MFTYFTRLYQKHRRRILPIAVFSYDVLRDEPDCFQIGFPFLDVLRFNFYKVELRKRNWRDYIHSENPVAAALLSKMGYGVEEKVRVKVEFMRMLTRMRLDPARMTLLIGFFESYLKLTQDEDKEFQLEIQNLDQKETIALQQITTSWHIEGQIEMMLIMAKKRFGMVSADLEREIRALPKEKIGAVGEALLDVNSIEELRALMAGGS